MVIVWLVAAAVIASVVLIYLAQNYMDAYKPEYEAKLFNGEVVTINFEVDPDDWQDFLDNASTKEYISADATINGELISNVGIRTKGNSSLSTVVSSDSDRYSINVKFNYYVKGQNFYGLDVMALNNIIGDATYMKDLMTFDMMSYMGVKAPLVSYANISVNGEHYGLCMMIERYEKAYLGHAYNTSAGQLYNVKMSGGMGGGGNRQMESGGQQGGQQRPENGVQGQGVRFNEQAGTGQQGADASQRQGGNMAQISAVLEDSTGAENHDAPNNLQGERPQFGGGTSTTGGEQTQPEINPGETPQGGAGEAAESPQSGEQQSNNREQQGGRGGMGGGMQGRGGGDLVYVDDKTSSYPSIFDNAVFNPKDADTTKVLRAIKALNEGENIEKYWNVDQILRYFAVHNFVVNLDSYSSGMAQNYYLYERDGVIEVLPWDYNYGFGAFQSSSTSGVINFPIDTPVSGVDMSERPLLNKLLENEEYLELYHKYLDELVAGYVESGLYNQKVDEIAAQIGEYVKTDTTAFYTFEQFEAATVAIKEYGRLRGKSIKGQLEGTIPSTAVGQTENPQALLDVGSFNISTMGSMGGSGGGMGGNRGGQTAGVNSQTEASETQGENAVQSGKVFLHKLQRGTALPMPKHLKVLHRHGCFLQ